MTCEHCAPKAETERELIDRLRGLLDKAHELPWDQSWDTKRNGDGWAWMEASGPQTMALKETDPRFQKLVVEQAFADAELMAEAVNALPRLLEIAERQISA